MKKIFSNFIPLLLLLAFFSPYIYSQGYLTFRTEQEKIAEQARWRFGPFLIYPGISFNNVGYDNNIYSMREEEDPISDYTATVSPHATIYLLFKNRLIFSFSVNPAYVFYIEEKDNRALNISYSPEFRLLLLNRFVLSGNYQYQRGKIRVTSEFDSPEWQKINGFGGRLFFETSRETSFGFTGSIKTMKYEDVTFPGQEFPLSNTLNREEKEGKVEFHYGLSKETFFFLNVGYTDYNFESIEAQGNNTYSYQLYSGISFPLLGKIRGTLSLGYKKFIPRDKARNDFSGVVGDTSLEFRLGRFNFRLLYNKDTPFSYGANIFFIINRYSVGASFYLTSFLRLEYDFSYGGGQYPEGELVELPGGGFEEVKREDTYSVHSAGLVFRIVKKTGIGLKVDYWKRDSNIPGVGRNRTFIGGYLTFDF